MEKAESLVLGGGITGLAIAYRLSKKSEVTLLEGSDHVGGWMGTDTGSGFHFEQGPRTFRTSAEPLLALIKELGLEDDLIYAEGKARYLWIDGKLRKVPSPYFWKNLIWPFMKEWAVAPSEKEETIYAFATRRFGKRVAELFFDPITLGVYAGDMRELSMECSFPTLKSWEKEYGSFTRALLMRKRRNGPTLFSLRHGTQQLVDRLALKLKKKIKLNESVDSIQFLKQGVEVRAGKNIWLADQVISTLPAHALAPLIASHDKVAAELLNNIPYRGLHLVHLGYADDLLPIEGFGYLVPSSEKSNVLGAIFDSSIFPQHNHHPKETRLTVMIREECIENPVSCALRAVKTQLGIDRSPDTISAFHARRAIPQFTPGHAQRMEQLKARLPHLHLAGSYLSGVSVNDCVKTMIAE
jgi:oxygen-dependent protoporphyrinogen oxidase